MNILVKLQAEADNQYDFKAIAFVCKVHNNWERIGYVVHEVLNKVYETISNMKIYTSCVV